MKHIIILFLTALIAISCSKQSYDQVLLPNGYVHVQEVAREAMQNSKDIFYASDSANEVISRIVWADGVKPAFVFDESGTVFRSANIKDTTQYNFPCMECSFDNAKYMVEHAIVEHERLDSAIIKAKIAGVGGIFGRSPHNVWYRDTITHWVDSIEYLDYYGDYMSRAQLVCIHIKKEKRKYIVNAAISVGINTMSKENGEIDIKIDEKSKEEFKKQMQEHIDRQDEE